MQCSQSSQNTLEESFIPEDILKYNSTQSDTLIDSQETLKQVKDKFNDPSTSTAIKTMIMTLAPKLWSKNKLATSRRQSK